MTAPDRRRLAPAALLAAALAAAPALAQDDGTVEVELRTAEGEGAGTVTLRQVEQGLVVTARLENLPEGEHGFHVHETGACEPDFEAAGGHYNPNDATHGFDSPGGYHAGDLPNVHIAADGTVTAEFFSPLLTLAAREDDEAPYTLRDADGSAIMVHAQPDDYRTDPSGAAGDRIACGVIAPAGG